MDWLRTWYQVDPYQIKTRIPTNHPITSTRSWFGEHSNNPLVLSGGLPGAQPFAEIQSGGGTSSNSSANNKEESGLEDTCGSKKDETQSFSSFGQGPPYSNRRSPPKPRSFRHQTGNRRSYHQTTEPDSKQCGKQHHHLYTTTISRVFEHVQTLPRVPGYH